LKQKRKIKFTVDELNRELREWMYGRGRGVANSRQYEHSKENMRKKTEIFYCDLKHAK